MRAATSRLKKIESELNFQMWLQGSRLFDGFSSEQLLAYAEGCELPNPPPELLSKAAGKYDGLDKRVLLRLYKEEQETILRMNIQEGTFGTVLFYVKNGELPATMQLAESAEEEVRARLVHDRANGEHEAEKQDDSNSTA